MLSSRSQYTKAVTLAESLLRIRRKKRNNYSGEPVIGN